MNQKLLPGVLVGLGVSCLTLAVCMFASKPAPLAAGKAHSHAQGAQLELVSQSVAKAPTVDGERDAIWESASVTTLPMMRGLHGKTPAFTMRLQSLYTNEMVYFLAEWPDAGPCLDDTALTNRLTMHFDLQEPWPGARAVTCLVACHTAYAGENARLAYMTVDTIPTGWTDPLPAAGGWSEGVWRLEWSRPLVYANLFDVQFGNREVSYPLFVKVFEHDKDAIDPVSVPLTLTFAR